LTRERTARSGQKEIAEGGEEEQAMIIKDGHTGPHIIEWQAFLAGLGYFCDEYYPRFGPKTKQATIKFQRDNGLKPDGVVGPNTLGRARTLGWPGFSDEPIQVVTERPIDENTAEGYMDPSYPPPLDADFDGEPDVPYRDYSWREKELGGFLYKAAPTKNNPERIKILDGWDKKNIVQVELPMLKNRGIEGFPTSGKVYWHKRGVRQLVGVFEKLEKEGLLPYILTWGGTFVPRFVRGSKSVLSNHSFGTAVDLNVPWNYMGQRPAMVGERGTLRPLVPIFEEFDFYWGGRYKRRPDGMHYECVRLWD